MAWTRYATIDCLVSHTIHSTTPNMGLGSQTFNEPRLVSRPSNYPWLRINTILTSVWLASHQTNSLWLASRIKNTQPFILWLASIASLLGTILMWPLSPNHGSTLHLWLAPYTSPSLCSSVCFPNKKVWVAMREFWRATTPMLCQVFRNVLIACSTILYINVSCSISSILCFLFIYFKISLGISPLSIIGCFWFDSKFRLLSFLILIPYVRFHF